MIDYIVGLDLSLTSTGGVAVPTDWGRDWDEVDVFTAGYAVPVRKEKRLERDADPLLWEAERIHRIGYAVDHFLFCLSNYRQYSIHVVIEGMHVSRNLAVVKALSRLRGAVDEVLYTLSKSNKLTWSEVTPSEWRKVLHGTANGTTDQVKAQTKLVLEEAGCPKDWNGDQRDAFGVANFGLREYPRQFFALPAPGVK